MSNESGRSGNEGSQLSAVRQRKLLEAVQSRGAMSVRDLCDFLEVSDATIRRDIGVLDKKGLVSRTHGGVVANKIVQFDLPDSDRLKINENEKRRIGEAAIDMLEGSETVMIDAGTTGLSVAMHAKKKPNCTYVTTSLGVSQILKQVGIEDFYLVGGSYLPINDSFCGVIASSAIRAITFDVAFLCTTAIDLRRRSVSLGSETYAQVQREIVDAAHKKYVVADSTKFRSSAFLRTAKFDEITGIITDNGVDASVKLALENEELELKLT